MLLPAIIIFVPLFTELNNFSGRQKAAIKVALAGQLPDDMKDIYVREESWTDYLVWAFFRSNPESLQAILESPPFEGQGRPWIPFQVNFSIFTEAEDKLPFIVKDALVFKRSDLEKHDGDCTVYTDSQFSFAYIEYSVD